MLLNGTVILTAKGFVPLHQIRKEKVAIASTDGFITDYTITKHSGVYDIISFHWVKGKEGSRLPQDLLFHTRDGWVHASSIRSTTPLTTRDGSTITANTVRKYTKARPSWGYTITTDRPFYIQTVGGNGVLVKNP